MSELPSTQSSPAEPPPPAPASTPTYTASAWVFVCGLAAAYLLSLTDALSSSLGFGHAVLAASDMFDGTAPALLVFAAGLALVRCPDEPGVRYALSAGALLLVFVGLVGIATPAVVDREWFQSYFSVADAIVGGPGVWVALGAMVLASFRDSARSQRSPGILVASLVVAAIVMSTRGIAGSADNVTVRRRDIGLLESASVGSLYVVLPLLAAATLVVIDGRSPALRRLVRQAVGVVAALIVVAFVSTTIGHDDDLPNLAAYTAPRSLATVAAAAALVALPLRDPAPEGEPIGARLFWTTVFFWPLGFASAFYSSRALARERKAEDRFRAEDDRERVSSLLVAAFCIGVPLGIIAFAIIG